MGFFENTGGGLDALLNQDKINEQTGEIFSERWERLKCIEIDKIENFNGHIDITDGVGTDLYDKHHQGHSLKYIGTPTSALQEAVCKANNLRYINQSECCIKGDRNKLISLTMPSTVIRIEERAFIMCYELQKITLSENLEYIGKNAFAECLKLTEIAIPKGVTYIGENAFRGARIENISLPKCFKGQLKRIGLTADAKRTYI